MLLIWFQALPSVRIAVLFAFRLTDIASRKIPRQAVCLPWEMKRRLLRLAGFNPPSLRRRQASDHRRSLRQPIRHQ